MISVLLNNAFLLISAYFQLADLGFKEEALLPQIDCTMPYVS